MIGPQELELAVFRTKTLFHISEVEESETLLIAIDLISDFRVAEAMARTGEAVIHRHGNRLNSSAWLGGRRIREELSIHNRLNRPGPWEDNRKGWR